MGPDAGVSIKGAEMPDLTAAAMQTRNSSQRPQNLPTKLSTFAIFCVFFSLLQTKNSLVGRWIDIRSIALRDVFEMDLKL